MPFFRSVWLYNPGKRFDSFFVGLLKQERSTPKLPMYSVTLYLDPAVTWFWPDKEGICFLFHSNSTQLFSLDRLCPRQQTQVSGAPNPSHLAADGVNYPTSWSAAGHLLLWVQLRRLHLLPLSSPAACGWGTNNVCHFESESLGASQVSEMMASRSVIWVDMTEWSAV